MGPAGQKRTALLEHGKAACRIAREIGLVAAWDGAPGLGALLVAGPDAALFLQAQLTSDVAALDPGDSQPSARLTRSGGLVAHFLLARLPDRGQPFPSFLLVLPIPEIPDLLADLQASVITEDVLLEDARAEFVGLLAQGPGAEELLTHLDEPTAVLLWRHSWTGDPGWLALAPSGRSAPWGGLLAEVHDAGFVELENRSEGRQVWRWLTLEAGWPRAGADFEPGRTLLPATGLDRHTVSATKGCYRGQEVVARVRTYGSVPKALRGLVVHEPRSLESHLLPKVGEPLLDQEGRRIGAWASTGYSASYDRVVALVYLDREHREPRDRVVVQAGEMDLEVEIVLLPLYAAEREVERAADLHARAMRRFNGGDDRAAAALLEEALRLDPGLTDAYEALGVILGRAGRYHEAIDVFQRLAEIAPDEPMVHTNLSLFYMKIGDRAEAENQKALASRKRSGGERSGEERAMRQAGEEAARRLDAERKREMFAEVLAVDPEDGLALMGMGNALLELQDHEGAEEHLARALRVQPDNSVLYVSRGKVLEKLGRREEAEAAYRAGVRVAGRRGDFLPLKELEHRLFVLESAAE